jgi:hypothetical protein
MIYPKRPRDIRVLISQTCIELDLTFSILITQISREFLPFPRALDPSNELLSLPTIFLHDTQIIRC